LQLAALERAARAKGARWSALDLNARRALLDEAFAAAGVRNLPGRPAGQHVIADLMAFYFPQQRRERRLLPRADQPRGLPADRDHDEAAGIDQIATTGDTVDTEEQPCTF